MSFVNEPSFIISILAIVIAAVTLWLTELRGPNITLVNKPEFAITDRSVGFSPEINYEYTPRYLSFANASFLFSNYGGKDGSIVNLEITFQPISAFKQFNSFSTTLSYFENNSEVTQLPVVIREGTNVSLKATCSIMRSEWKKDALATALNPRKHLETIISDALKDSKSNFRSYCEFLENNQTIGSISCTLTFTKGRFKTKIMKKELISNTPVFNQCKESLLFFRQCLLKWDELAPTYTELENEVLTGIVCLLTEMDSNISNLSISIEDKTLASWSAIKPRIDQWQRLQKITDPERKIQWFLIDSDSSLKNALANLYENVKKYNNKIEKMIVSGGYNSSEDYMSINEERERLKQNTVETRHELSELKKRVLGSPKNQINK